MKVNEQNTKQPTRRIVVTIEVFDVAPPAQDERPPQEVIDWGQWLPNSMHDTEPKAPEAEEPAQEPQEPRGIVAQASRPTYATGRAKHPVGDDRKQHERYTTGRKVHRCSVCKHPHTRFNYILGSCAGARRTGIPCVDRDEWTDTSGGV